MAQRIHRERLMFRWITKNHEIVVGFKHMKYNTCTKCGKDIPQGNSLCDKCFEKSKAISKK